MQLDDPLLRRFWPPTSQILLLTAAVSEPEPARRAWQEWNATRTLDTATTPEVRLLATICRRIPELEPNSPLLPRLGGARRYIWTRTQITLNATVPLIGDLAGHGIRMMLLKGAARIAAMPALATERTLRDVDVLVHPDDWDRSIELVGQLGWRPDTGELTPDSYAEHHAINLQSPHPGADGSVDLHHHALYACRNIGDDEGLWRRSLPVAFQGIPLRMPSPADEMVITLAHALRFSPTPGPADWALDIASIVRSRAVDWSIVDAETRNRGIELLVASPLLLANEHLGLPIPEGFIRSLVGSVAEPFSTELVAYASGYTHARQSLVEAMRNAAASRAVRAAARLPSGGPSHTGTKTRLKSEHVPLLPGHGRATFAVPTDIPLSSYLRIELSFYAEASQGRAGLDLNCPGIQLLVWREKSSETGKVQFKPYRISVEVPAALFRMRRIESVRIRAWRFTTIRDFELRWTISARPRGDRPLKRIARLLGITRRAALG